MINLLPDTQKRELAAARNNSTLLAYDIWLLAAIVFVLLAFIGVYAMFGIGQKTAEDNIAANQAKVANYSSVRKQGEEFSQNLSIAKKIFASQINYSELLVKIAGSLPQGSSLQSLTLDSTTLGGKSTQFLVNVTSPDKAIEVKNSLAANTAIFSNVYVQSIVSQTGGAYPYTATIAVTINQEAVKQ